MISPVLNTPLPFEPARQQVTPSTPAVTLPPQPMPVAEQPLPAATTPKDKFAAKDGKQENDDALAKRQQQQQYELTRAQNSAWARLAVLQELAREAVGAGNGPQAKEAAIEAGAVAASIRDMTDTLPGISFGIVDIPAALDNARSGLGTAMSVVDLADAIPHHPAEDRQAISGARVQVVQAMAGVEAVATELLPAPQRLSSNYAPGLDVKA